MLVGLVLVLLILSTLVGTQAPDNREDPRASTFLTSTGGLQALYWTLEEVKIPVARRTAPLVGAGGTDSLPRALALISPAEQPTPAEMHALAEHVRGGGTLVFAASPWPTGGQVYDTLGLDVNSLPGAQGAEYGEGAAATARPHRWTEGTRTVKGFRRGFADSSRVVRERRATVLLEAGGKPVAITYKMGGGTVVAFADARPLTNERLRTSGAAPVFARAAAELAAGGALTFDEYHQGFQGDGSVWKALRRFLAEHPAGHASLQLFAVLLLLMLAAGRRFGAPLPPPPARRRSPLEHVDALAGAYRQAGAKRTARRLLVAGMARRLGKRAPADEAGAAELLGRMATASPVGRDAAAALQTEWKRGTDAELVSVARRVDDLLDEVKR
ncbi:DUF4350 domain-containing protein [Longimicrobium sp.]|jgi:hypothetical protein|uniref:DUF4350 domain-containing protein n=1 Tax=Longimicrobium sp. TaxID=2029185 RepID=UPI002F93DEA2